MLESGGAALGEAAVDVYADLSRLDRDLAEAKRKVERFAADTQAQIGAAVNRASRGGALAMPTKQLDDFAAHMAGVLASVTKQSQTALGTMTQQITAASTKASKGVDDLAKSAENATTAAKVGLAGLNGGVDQLVTNIHRLDAAGEQAAANVQRRVNAPAAGRRAGPGNAANAATRAASKEAQDLDRSVEQLAKSYSPLHAAQIRYAQDLEKIQTLQSAGVLGHNDAAMFAGKAAAELRKATDEQSKVFQWAKRAGEQVRQYSGIAAVAFGVAALAAVQSSMTQVRAIKSTADQLQMSTDQWQEWRYIASQVNVPLSQIDQGFEQLRNTMGRAATGSASEVKLFKELGISLIDTSGKAKDVNTVMRELADTLPRVTNENQRAAAMQKLFGENAAEFTKVLSGGSAEIDKLGDAAHRFGQVLSADEIQKVDETAKKIGDLKNELSADVSRAVANNAASIIGLANALTQVTGAIVGFLGSNPQAALGILGALAGLRFGGIYGAIGGGLAGISAANRMQDSQNNSNNDIRFRAGAYKGAAQDMRESDTWWNRTFNPTKVQASKQNFEFQKQLFAGSVMDQFNAGKGQLDARTRAAGGVANPISLSNLNAPKPAAGKKGGGGRTRADGYEKELANLEMQLLQAMGSQVTNAEDRAKIDMAILDAQKRRYNAGVDMEVKTKRYSAAEGELLKAKYTEIDAVKRTEIQQRKEDQQLKDRTSITAAGLSASADILGAQKQLARTTGKRRDLELQLLSIQGKIEAAQLDAVIASHDSSDTEKKIAEQRKKHLAELQGLQRQIILRETQGPVADFFDKIPQTAAEIDEAVKRIRASNLEDLQQRTVNFADSIGDAFGNMTRNIFALQSPMKILQGLLADLASTFTEETVVRPVKDWARRKIGGPAAERFVGGTAGQEGLSMKAIENSSLAAATKVDAMALAAMRAEQALNAIGAGALGETGKSPLSLLDAATGGAGDVGASIIDPLKGLGDRAFDASDALAKATSAANDMGRSLPNVVQQLLASTSGGGGGGGLLQTVLGIASSAFGGVKGVSAGFRPSAGLLGSAQGAISANAAIFHEGGEIGMDDRPVRRPLAHGERNITARVGEGVLNVSAMRRLPKGFLDSINAGRLPALRGISPTIMRGGDTNLRVSLGSIVLPGVTDTRSGRIAGKVVAAELHRGISRASKTGISRND